ncbi:hypothetical protein [Citricoccus sp. CH26A]|uniref:hypothetical protein n=1 Tax=Citricoccus TaxID=169133 RepID=UPI0009FF5CBD|nr:hypothetical protein [Citricoccus sp. CH26A]
MEDLIKARLAELKTEIEIGERRWQEANLEQARLRDTLTRMSGAIQILHELLEAKEPLNDHTKESASVTQEGPPG